MHVKRTLASARSLIVILALTATVAGLDAAVSYAGRSAAGSSRSSTSTRKASRGSRRPKCTSAAARRARRAKHLAVTHRCAHKPAGSSSGTGAGTTPPAVPGEESASAPGPSNGGSSLPGSSGGASNPVEPVEPVDEELQEVFEPLEHGVPAESGALVESGSGSSAPFRFFSSSSFWNEPISASAPVAPNSAKLVAAFDAVVASEREHKKGPWINTIEYSIPVYTVSESQPTVHVAVTAEAHAPALQAAMDAVPLPSYAKPARGTDKALVVWQPSTNRLWDFWRLVYANGAWSTSWGGAMQNVTSGQGVYSPEAWPGAQSTWGDSASSLEPVGGLMSLEDLKMGTINHALAIAIPEPRESVFASPAKRTDGTSSSSLALPEGAHLRLNPKLNLASLHLPHLTLMIAEAAQKYGIFVRDKAQSIAFYGQDPTPTGTDPYTGSGGYYEGKLPSEILAAFPWSQLEVMKMELQS